MNLDDIKAALYAIGDKFPAERRALAWDAARNYAMNLARSADPDFDGEEQAVFRSSSQYWLDIVLNYVAEAREISKLEAKRFIRDTLVKLIVAVAPAISPLLGAGAALVAGVATMGDDEEIEK